MARVNGDPKYATYRDGKCFQKPVEILKASGVDLSYGGGLEELQQFQEYISDYTITVYDGLNPDRLLFSGIPFRIRNCTYFMMRIRVITL
jgi:hypothetical protein